MGGNVDAGQGAGAGFRVVVDPAVFPGEILPVVGIFGEGIVDGLVDDAVAVLIDDDVVKKALDEFGADAVLLGVALEGLDGDGSRLQFVDVGLGFLQLFLEVVRLGHGGGCPLVLPPLGVEGEENGRCQRKAEEKV